MRHIKEFLCDGSYPTNEEIEKCIRAAKNENCVIFLRWIAVNSQMYSIFIEEGSTFEECMKQIPSFIPM